MTRADRAKPPTNLLAAARETIRQCKTEETQ